MEQFPVAREQNASRMGVGTCELADSKPRFIGRLARGLHATPSAFMLNCCGGQLDPEVLQSMRNLLLQTRVLSLAVSVDNEPEAALLPYALRSDFAGVYVQASDLARHARGLQPGARVGLLVHATDSDDADPLQLTRLTVQAVVSVVDRESAAFAPAAARFVERFPAARMTLGLADFNLYELTFGRGRFVEGFARAFNVGAHTFAELAAL